MRAAAVVGFVLLALAPAVQVPGRPARELQALVAMVGAVALWGALWAGAAVKGVLATRREPARLAWGVVVAAAVASTAISPDPWFGVLTIGATAAAAAAHGAISNGVLPREFVQGWAGAVLAGAGVAACGLSVAFGGETSGWLPAVAALALPWTAPLFTAGGATGWRRLALLPCALALVPLAAVAGAATAWVGAVGFVAAIVACHTRRRVALVLVVLLVGPAVGFVARRELAEPRSVWAAAARLGAARPLLGHGPGTFEMQVGAHGRAAADARSGALQLWAEQGAVGAAAALLLAYVVLRRWVFFVRRQEEPEAQAATAAAGGAVLGMVGLALVHPWVLSPAHIVQFGLVTGMMEYVGNRRPLSRSRDVKAVGATVFTGLTLLVVLGGLNAQRRLLAAWAYDDAALESDPIARERRLRDCTAWDVRHWRAQRELGRLLLAAGKPYDAAGPLELAVEVAPYDVEALLLLAEAYGSLESRDERERRRAQALDLLDRAERIDPGARRQDLRRHKPDVGLTPAGGR